MATESTTGTAGTRGATLAQRASRSFVWRGIAAMLFGVIIAVLPGMTAFLLVALFGAYALVDGVVAFAEGIRLRREHARSWPSFVEGIAGVALAAFAWARPAGLLLVVVLAIAARSLVIGALELGAAIARRHDLEHPVLLGVAGFLSLAFGVALAVNPSIGALALLWLCAAYAFAFGVSFIALGLSVRRAARPTATAVTLLVVGLGLGLGVVAQAAQAAQVDEGQPVPTDEAPRPPERAVPSPETTSFNSLEEKERRARERAEDELLRLRHPVAGHEFSPNRPSTTDQPGMPAPNP